jgi:hypothetical protein
LEGALWRAETPLLPRAVYQSESSTSPPFEMSRYIRKEFLYLRKVFVGGKIG